MWPIFFYDFSVLLVKPALFTSRMKRFGLFFISSSTLLFKGRRRWRVSPKPEKKVRIDKKFISTDGGLKRRTSSVKLQDECIWLYSFTVMYYTVYCKTMKPQLLFFIIRVLITTSIFIWLKYRYRKSFTPSYLCRPPKNLSRSGSNNFICRWINICHHISIQFVQSDPVRRNHLHVVHI